MHNEYAPTPRLKGLGTLIMVAIFVAGLAACGPTTQATKPDESSGSQGGYGGYGY